MYTYSDSLFDTPETKTTWLISYPPAKIKKKIQVYLTVLTHLTGLKSRCQRSWFLSGGEVRIRYFAFPSFWRLPTFLGSCSPSSACSILFMSHLSAPSSKVKPLSSHDPENFFLSRTYD